MATSGPSLSALRGTEDQALVLVTTPGGASIASASAVPASASGAMETTVGEHVISPGTASTAPEGTVDTCASSHLSVETYLGSVRTEDKPVASAIPTPNF